MSSPFPAPCTCPPELRETFPEHLIDCPQYVAPLPVDSQQPTTNVDRSPTGDKRYEICGSARRKQPGEVCKRPAGWGTDHAGSGRCKLHGGNTPNGRKQGQKEKAKKARDTFGLSVEIDPTDALLQEVWRTQGHVVWLGREVSRLRKQDVAWGKTRVKVGGEDGGTTYEAKVNAYVALYQDERKHLARVSSEAIKAGVETKRLGLETQRAELVVNMLGTIFDALDLTTAQSLLLEELVPNALKAIATSEVAS